MFVCGIEHLTSEEHAPVPNCLDRNGPGCLVAQLLVCCCFVDALASALASSDLRTCESAGKSSILWLGRDKSQSLGDGIMITPCDHFYDVFSDDDC